MSTTTGEEFETYMNVVVNQLNRAESLEEAVEELKKTITWQSEKMASLKSQLIAAHSSLADNEKGRDSDIKTLQDALQKEREKASALEDRLAEAHADADAEGKREVIKAHQERAQQLEKQLRLERSNAADLRATLEESRLDAKARTKERDALKTENDQLWTDVRRANDLQKSIELEFEKYKQASAKSGQEWKEMVAERDSLKIDFEARGRTITLLRDWIRTLEEQNNTRMARLMAVERAITGELK